MSKKFLSGINVTGTATLNTVADAGSNTDKFLVLDSSNNVSYRTAAELYADLGIGSTAAAYTSTLKHEVKASQTISKGQAVYVSSADGTNMVVSKASNVSEQLSSKTMGLLETSLTTNGKGKVVTEGLLAGLNTSSANAGDPVWLGVDGALIYGLANKPYAPAHLVFIGIVTRAHANQGEIFVKVQNGFELKEIHDVDLITTTPINGHILGYNGTLWVNKTIAGWLGYTPADDSLVVKLAGTQTITGTKRFQAGVRFPDSGNGNQSSLFINTGNIEQASGGENAFGFNSSNNIYFNKGITSGGSGINGGIISFNNTASRTYTLPDASGTIALTSDIPSLSGYVPTSRTITINGTTFDLSADRSWTITSMIYPAAGIALSTGTGWGTSITDNSANWNTAFGWGNHASAGYATTGALSSYLLLAGGTLTGALNGTSALFTGNLRTDTGLGLKYGSFVSTSGYLNLFSAIIGSTMTLNLKDGTGGFEIALTFSASANRNYTFPSANGTIALTSDIPSLSGYVPTSRTITINGTTLDLSANRSFTVTASETDTLATVTGRGASTSTPVVFTGNMAAWNATTPGLGLGTIQLGAANGTSNFGAAITFAARDGGGGSNAQAGIYVVSDGAYGTRMYFATTDAYVTGSKTAMSISETGVVNFVRANATVQGNGLIHAGNIGSQSVSTAAAAAGSSFLTQTNATWGARIQLGGNGDPGAAAGTAVVQATDGNLHMDCGTGKSMYLNYYRNGIIYLNGGTYSISANGSQYNGNSATTSQRDFNYLRINSNNHLYLDYNHGQSIIGVYSASRYQGVFSMGAAYVLPLDGTSPGNLYGMAWSHPNAGGQAGYLNDHGLLVMVNGLTYAAISSNIWARGSITANANLNAGGTTYSASYRGNANVGGTGEATWHPAGIYCGGTMWQYGAMYKNNTAIHDVQDIYNRGWFRNYGDSGLYNQDYGCHLVRNNESSHGAWSIFGYTKAGYIGMNLRDPQTYNNNLMYENGNGGMYTENANGWQWYYNRGSNCLGLGGSTTYNWVRAVVNGKLKIESDSIHTGWAYFDSNLQLAGGGNILYNEYNLWYVWKNWGGWGGEWMNRNGGDIIGNFYAIYAVTGSVSDIRYKKEVTPVTYGLNEIMRLNPIKYKYNMPKESMLANDPDFFLGFSAQEVQGIIPEAVHEKMESGNKDGMLAITYDELIPVLVNGIKEQQVMIHNQNIKINKLEALVNQLLNN